MQKGRLDQLQPACFVNICAGFSSILPIRVATVTSTTVVLVTTHTLMVVVGLRIGVAAQTTERSVVAACMAVNTLIPFVLVFTGKNREIHSVVIKRGRYPGGFVVAVGTGRRESH